MEAKKKCKRLQKMDHKEGKCDNNVRLAQIHLIKIPIDLMKRLLIPNKWSLNGHRSVESDLLWRRGMPQIMTIP